MRRNGQFQPICASTRLADDLGLDGDDAYDLMMAFAAYFNLELTGFEFSGHFGPVAAWNPFYAAYQFLTGRGRREPLIVGKLADAVERGRWGHTGAKTPQS